MPDDADGCIELAGSHPLSATDTAQRRNENDQNLPSALGMLQFIPFSEFEELMDPDVT